MESGKFEGNKSNTVESEGSFQYEVEGVSVVLEKVNSEEGVCFIFKVGSEREIDEAPGYAVLLVSINNEDGFEDQQPEGDYETCGLGFEHIIKDGVEIDLRGGRRDKLVTGPDEETVKRVLDDLRFTFVNPYEI